MAVDKRKSHGSTADGRSPLKGSGLQTGRYPSIKPNFTLKDIRNAIPAHCFKRSAAISLRYLAIDVLLIVLLGYASTWIDHPVVPRWLAYGLLWPSYWFWQGAVATGIWVIAHECGHGAFSESEKLNDAVGLIFHSLLLVPYFSWKHSHRRHHQHTSSTELDEVFVPLVKPAGTKAPWFQKSYVFRAGAILIQQILGWPLYLFFNISGHYYERWANHFDPSSPIFTTKRERLEVVVSDMALLAGLTGLAAVSRTFGFMWLLKVYIIPYLVVNHWLVMITFLQHTHPKLPHYGEGEWDWLRGAMSTVDRSYGILDVVFHHIGDTHVAHHLFSYMPHYHAQEATEAIRKVLGDYYAYDKRNVFRALWEDVGECALVTSDEGGSPQVYWYK